MVTLLLAIFLLLIIALLLGFVISGFRGAVWVPTFAKDIEQMLDDAKLKKGELFIELGCGEGRMLIAAANRGAKAIGYEINPTLWLIAKIRTAKYRNISVKLGDFWHHDLSQANVVMAFLMAKFMPDLEAKLQAELKPGARFINYIFKLPTKKPSVSQHHWWIYKF